MCRLSIIAGYPPTHSINSDKEAMNKQYHYYYTACVFIVVLLNIATSAGQYVCCVYVIVWWCNLCMYMHACGCACSCQRVSVRRMISLEYCWFLYLLRNNKRVWAGEGEHRGTARGEGTER